MAKNRDEHDNLLVRNTSRKVYRVGDLIFSRSGFSGIVLEAETPPEFVKSERRDIPFGYLIVWTIITGTHADTISWKFNTQFRYENTLRDD